MAVFAGAIVAAIAFLSLPDCCGYLSDDLAVIIGTLLAARIYSKFAWLQGGLIGSFVAIASFIILKKIVYPNTIHHPDKLILELLQLPVAGILAGAFGSALWHKRPN